MSEEHNDIYQSLALALEELTRRISVCNEKIEILELLLNQHATVITSLQADLYKQPVAVRASEDDIYVPIAKED